ncbi:MAG: hypothetical protein ACJ74P_03390, partial [Gaiellaceae bacterium]
PNNQQSNIKVNQNCLNLSDPDLQGRGQAQNEESIAVDPNNTNHLVAFGGPFHTYRRRRRVSLRRTRRTIVNRNESVLSANHYARQAQYDNHTERWETPTLLVSASQIGRQRR